MSPPQPRRRTVHVRADELSQPGFRPDLGQPPETHEAPGEAAPETTSDIHEVGLDAGRDLRFADFYRASWDQIARGLTATLGDRDLAVDATDEAMARAYAHWGKIGGYDFPTGWVYRVGLNWARSYHRRLSRALPLRRSEPAELDGGRAHRWVDGITDPAIRDAVVALDIKHRSVVVCRLLLDWSVDDTATALDIAPGTVKSRLSRALTILESTLGHLR